MLKAILLVTSALPSVKGWYAVVVRLQVMFNSLQSSPQNLAVKRLLLSEVIWLGRPKRSTHRLLKRTAVSAAVLSLQAGMNATRPERVSVATLSKLCLWESGRVSTQSMAM